MGKYFCTVFTTLFCSVGIFEPDTFASCWFHTMEVAYNVPSEQKRVVAIHAVADPEIVERE